MISRKQYYIKHAFHLLHKINWTLDVNLNAVHWGGLYISLQWLIFYVSLRKHIQKEIEELQQRERAEREAWEEHTKSVLEAQCAARENGLRDQLKRERDRQLETAIRRLEKESNDTRTEVEQEAEGKIRWVRFVRKWTRQQQQVVDTHRHLQEIKQLSSHVHRFAFQNDRKTYPVNEK